MRFELTPTTLHNVLPIRWGKTAATLPITTQEEVHSESIKQLVDMFEDGELDAINVYDTKWGAPLHKKIQEASYPLKSILAADSTLTRGRLAYWELYSEVLIDSLSERLSSRAEALRRYGKAEPLMVELRSLHLGDDDSPDVLNRILDKIRTGVPAAVDLNWRAVGTSAHGENWLNMEPRMTISTMKTLRNYIMTNLNSMDIYIDNSRSDNKTLSVVFSLLNLSCGGYAMIYLPKIAHASLAAAIHVFRYCFEKSYLIHLVADDRVYLCGECFLGNLTPAEQKTLFEFCEISVDAPNAMPFTGTYVADKDFNETMSILIRTNNDIHYWRYRYYKNFLSAKNHLMKKNSARVFVDYADNYLAKKMKDKSAKWALRVSFWYKSH